MKLLQSLVICLMASAFLHAQEEDKFYARMFLGDAKALQKDFPSEVTLLDTSGNEVIVFMTAEASHQLHDRILLHGPGYVYEPSYEAALKSFTKTSSGTTRGSLDYTITENVKVNEVLNSINSQNIEDQILELQAYGSRYHTLPSATQSAVDLKTRWETMIADYGRTDASVRLYNHSATGMPSVILTIQGAELPDEYVIAGGHLDSTSWNTSDAPGADDDASGISTITEAIRSLFEIDFVPKRTIEIMAYAAEEIGLVGSNEIAEDYNDNNVNVVAYVQFDMTNYQGSADDIYFISDYTNPTLTNYLSELLDFYNSSGDHPISYNTTLCNYACSDHASWFEEGYPAAFPFESSFGQHNDNIHTPNDTYSVSGTSLHAAKFAKLCATYLIEVSKSFEPLGSATFQAINTHLYAQNDQLFYQIEEGAEFSRLAIFDLHGRLVLSVDGSFKGSGSIDTPPVAAGMYVVSFSSERFAKVTQKVTFN